MSARKATPYIAVNARGVRPMKKRGTVREPHQLVVIRLPWLHEIRRRPQSCVPQPMSEPPRAYAPSPMRAGDDGGD
ncbi:hypothetical protein LBMAG56_43040 [Verrucomicrobiota bacterium]|nr:hypothetical protein LBMAG56_43040 [Verrucomicrobiota bacterium]